MRLGRAWPGRQTLSNMVVADMRSRRLKHKLLIYLESWERRGRAFLCVLNVGPYQKDKDGEQHKGKEEDFTQGSPGRNQWGRSK